MQQAVGEIPLHVFSTFSHFKAGNFAFTKDLLQYMSITIYGKSLRVKKIAEMTCARPSDDLQM